MRIHAISAALLLSAVLSVGGCKERHAGGPPRTTQPDSSSRDRVYKIAGSQSEVRPPAPAYPAGWEENWPRFRGPTGDGLAPRADPPATLDLAKNVLFKVPVPAVGHGSPIVWGDRVYLTAEEERILAFDRNSGKLLWDTALRVPPPVDLGDGDDETDGEQEPEEETLNEDTGWAAPTACTDGQRVYAFFGSGVIGCVDAAGQQEWAFRLVDQPKSAYGLAASPILYGGRLIQVVDMGEGPDDGLSFVVALDPASGRELARAERPVASGWTTPVATTAPDGRAELITVGLPWVIAYAPRELKELWRAGKLTGDVAASPIVAGGLAYCLSGEGGKLKAVRIGGRGDVTDSRVAFTSNEPAPDVASPLCDGRRYYQISSSGDLICLDAATGEFLWEQDLKGYFWSSPVLAGGRIYAASKKGRLLVISPADGKVLSEVDLAEQTYASPAAVGKRLYVRTAKHLWRLGPAAAAQ